MAGLEERLRRILGDRGFKLFLAGLRIAEETGDPSWLYHVLGALYRDYYGGDTRYPPPPGEYYKSLPTDVTVDLPEPRMESGVDALEAIRSRRSRRSYGRSVTLQDLSDVLYYSVGVTGTAWWGGPKRAYPSAGALQPVEAYVIARSVDGLEPGIYHYNPGSHSLELVAEGDYSAEAARVALDQEHVGQAPAVIALTAVIARTASKYGYRSYRYVHWDSGHAGQNVYLAAEALGLATVAVGAYYDFELCRLLRIDCKTEMPMLLYPLGPRR